MSDTEDGGEFLEAFEDELYGENQSDHSSDEIDSELEEQLYQNVHFASSLVEEPLPNEQSATATDHMSITVNKPTSPVEQNDGHSSSVDKNCAEHGTQYPEVKMVFSDNKKAGIQKGEGIVANSFGCDGNSASESDQWRINSADLMAANPMASKKSKRSFMRCKNCNERGHRMFDCTQPKKVIKCSLCGQVGHRQRNCPNELCFNCQEPGHQSRNCTKPRQNLNGTCFRCQAYGHAEKFCPDKWKQYHLTLKHGAIVTSSKPFKCESNNIYCYNCGEKGHFGHECYAECYGRFDGSFPFVVKYDKFTSGWTSNGYKPLMNVTPSVENIIMNTNTKKKKQSKSKKKSSRKNKILYNEEPPSKRRKMEDTEVHSGNQGIAMDNGEPATHSLMEQPSETPPEQPVPLTKREIRRARRLTSKAPQKEKMRAKFLIKHGCLPEEALRSNNIIFQMSKKIQKTTENVAKLANVEDVKPTKLTNKEKKINFWKEKKEAIKQQQYQEANHRESNVPVIETIDLTTNSPFDPNTSRNRSFKRKAEEVTPQRSKKRRRTSKSKDFLRIGDVNSPKSYRNHNNRYFQEQMESNNCTANSRSHVKPQSKTKRQTEKGNSNSRVVTFNNSFEQMQHNFAAQNETVETQTNKRKRKPKNKRKRTANSATTDSRIVHTNFHGFV